MSEHTQPDEPGDPDRQERRRSGEGIRRDRDREAEPDEERRPRRRPRDDEDEDDPDRFRRSSGGMDQLIPYRNPQALIAYYCGVFALIPCAGLLLGPVALVLGFMGMSYSNRHPTAGGKGHAIAGVVLGLLTSVGNWGVLLLVAVGGLLGGLK